ncbi:PHP domain-containing protein [uncultured Clostridium sp.]|uniref:PHP domain-containing protein n=1 Tax=uncultured Clostridium sp. TaxID=59620 RepID=UPI0028E66B2E|nr:PHP domain-containing protein [uncultured Clostridium sp.]
MIDLHIHTNNSDGAFDVIDILKMSEEKKLEFISFTDHQSIDSYKKLADLNIIELYSGRIIKGIEIAFSFNGISMDMLGYNIDIASIEKSRILQANKNIDYIEIESSKLNHLLKVCNELKILHSSDLNIKGRNTPANDVICDDILSYAENLHILKKLEITDRTTFYRKHYLNPNSPFYIQPTEDLPNIYEAAETIHSSGGKCFFAHPYVYDVNNIDDYINNIVKLNLIDGIECIHRKHSQSQINAITAYCNSHNLLKSGGSDFHTLPHTLGYGNNGQAPIDYDIVMNWL